MKELFVLVVSKGLVGVWGRGRTIEEAVNFARINKKKALYHVYATTDPKIAVGSLGDPIVRRGEACSWIGEVKQ